MGTVLAPHQNHALAMVIAYKILLDWPPVAEPYIEPWHTSARNDIHLQKFVLASSSTIKFHLGVYVCCFEPSTSSRSRLNNSGYIV